MGVYIYIYTIPLISSYIPINWTFGPWGLPNLTKKRAPFRKAKVICWPTTRH
jgi:hypothetical protein